MTKITIGTDVATIIVLLAGFGTATIIRAFIKDMVEIYHNWRQFRRR